MTARRLCTLVVWAIAALAAAPSASADLPSLLATCAPRDALDADNATRTLPYTFCDDGVPAAAGGATPNPTAQSAIKVPSGYGGITGLPGTAAGESVPGEDPVDNTVALDVDVSLPDPAKFPAGGNRYPLVVMMHGCCGGSKTSWEGATIDPGGSENWHYNNAWFASRGYIVLTYTARGFVDAQNHGSTGETQLDSARYEINDYQHLAGQLADAGDLLPGAGEVRVDPGRVVPTGGSYGGGFTWLALTDPTWNSPGGAPMQVVAAATKYGWTNLVESLVPRGDDLRDALPETDAGRMKASLQARPGFPKRSINAALFASGKTGVPPGTSPHTTFPPAIDQAQVCLNSFDPFESNPLCTTTLQNEINRFVDERSAYYQGGFFAGLAARTVAPVPVFSAGTFTDPLFPAPEHRRMVERLKAASPGYPVQEFYGDYNHFVQNKRKEWADVCGADHHVCTYADYAGGDLNRDPGNRALTPGATSRLNRFIDHFARPPANPGQAKPAFDVTGSLQVCPQNARFVGAAQDEPGPRFTAATFASLAPNRLTVDIPGVQATTSKAGINPHAATSDPLANQVANGSRCPVENAPGGLAGAGAGVATYDSDPLPGDFTMLGATRAVVPHTGTGSGLQLNARLYDLHPDGTQVLMDRGVKRLSGAAGTTTLDLHGAGWKFARGHRIRIELAQDDDPYIKSSVQAGALSLAGVTLSVPIREGSTAIGGRAPSLAGAALRAPRLASDQGPRARFRLRVRRAPARGAAAPDHYQVEARDTRSSRGRRLTSRLRGSLVRFRGRLGHTYRFRARAINRAGVPGPWALARTIVPLDDARRPLRYRGSWRRARSRRAYGRRFSRSSRRGARISVRVRGSRIYLVGRRSRRGGKALVRINGRRKTVSFYGRRTRNRVVVASLRGKRRGVNRVRITVLGRKGAKRSRGRRVEIDAVAALRG